MSNSVNIRRAIQDRIFQRMRPGKAVVILGPRRSGKSHLLKEILSQFKGRYIFLNGEDVAVASLLRRQTFTSYFSLLHDNELVLIDEAQKIPGIGNALKFMVDSFPDVKVIATGSSMFDLDQNVGEPLTGRKTTFHLYPFAQQELNQIQDSVAIQSSLEDRLIFGSYPELLKLNSREDKAEYLQEIVNSYLLKDILALDSIRNSQKIFDLLRLLAFQVGAEVSLEELGKMVGMSKNTVERYFDLLSKCFVIQRVQGFSRNLRKEIVKTSKWYFTDNGIRNTIIANLNPLYLRDDTGALWENYMVTERLKYQANTGMLVNNFFWRTYDQQELDWIEDRGGQLYGYEFKWNANKTPKVPVAWANNYPGALFSVVNPSNYIAWITGDGMTSEEKLYQKNLKRKASSGKRGNISKVAASLSGKRKKAGEKKVPKAAKKRKTK